MEKWQKHQSGCLKTASQRIQNGHKPNQNKREQELFLKSIQGLTRKL